MGSPFAQHSRGGDYDIQAADGEIGHVEDFIIDDETWSIRYLIIGQETFRFDTANTNWQ